MLWSSQLILLMSVSALSIICVYADYIQFRLDSGLVTFWERATHSVNRLFSLKYVNLLFQLFPILVSMTGFLFCLFPFLGIAFLL